MNNITVENVTMKFKDTIALNNVNVTFEENKIYGLLGRNGAGKSTLLNAISNKIFPTSGVINVNGEPVLENQNALSNIYCMSESTYYHPSMSIKDVFRWSKEFYPNFNMDYAHKLSEKFGLTLKKKVKELSTGYTSIFKIIVALACNVEYVLLDEPVLGLDANHRELFYRELIESYAENPRTFIISTHLIEEITDIIEDIVIIKDGEILMSESAENIRKMGYGVSGKASDVDEFTVGKKTISAESLGGLKTTYVYGEKPSDINPTLEVSVLSLQQLFIQLTNT